MIFHQPDNSIGGFKYTPNIYEYCEWGHHFHKSFELVYVIDGELETQINDNIAILKKNDFAFVLPNDIHYYHTKKYSKVWIGVFSEDYVYDFSKYIHAKTSEKIAFECNRTELAFLKEVLINENKPDIYILKSALYMVINRYLKQIPLVEKKRYDENLSHIAIEYIENNFKEDITLKEMAKTLGYDYYYFSKWFNRAFNINFKTFLNQYRLEYAKNLLATTEKDISVIAMESGFGSIRNFNRVYKNFTGNSPKEMRKENLSPKTCSLSGI